MPNIKITRSPHSLTGDELFIAINGTAKTLKLHEEISVDDDTLSVLDDARVKYVELDDSEAKEKK